MGIKVGVPRGLLYFYYYPLWESFFNSLGVELVLSPKTSRPVLNKGVVLANDETCLPVKVFYGHVESLKQKEVDYVFLPRMVSMEKDTFLCPKLLGFPEVVTALVSDLPPVLTANFNLRSNSKYLDKALLELGSQLGFRHREIKKAAKSAAQAQKHFEQVLQQGHDYEKAIAGKDSEAAPREEGVIQVAVLGHAYVLYDAFTSLDIKGKLNGLGIRVITPESIRPKIIDKNLNSLPKKLFWSHSKRIYGAGLSLINDKQTHGIIHLSCFGCGPDSMIGDLVDRACRRGNKPFMMLTLDEHTGEAGVVTRLEAYVDMLKRRVEVENNLSTYG